MAAAWVTKESVDPTELTESGKKKICRQRAERGMKGVKENDQWVVEWIEPCGRRRREKIKLTGRPGKKLADERADQLTSQLTLGTYDSPEYVQWETFKKRYLEDALPTKRSVKTQEEIRYILDRFEGICKPKKMSAITSSLIDKYIRIRLRQKSRIGGPLSAATINKDLRHLRAVFRKAVKWKLLATMPDFDMLDELQRDKPHVTVEEFVAMYRSCDVATKPGDLPYPASDWWRALLVAAFGTGQRISDLLALEWKRVDLEKRRFQSLAEDNKHKRDRWVQFNVQVAKHLGRIRQLVDPRVFPWNHHKTTLYKELGRIQEAAGLDSKRRDFKFHANRRSFVSFNWDLLGPDEVQRSTGHRSQSTTKRYRVYVEEHRESAPESFMPELPKEGQGHAG